MNIQYPPALIPSLKDKYLLLDTNVFIDALVKPNAYKVLFNELRQSDVSLVSMDLVKYEFLQGAADRPKYTEKEKFFNSIIDAMIPLTSKTFELVYALIKAYGIEGKSPQTTDLILGAMLMQYGKNMFLLTRDTTDFIQNIFDLPHIINAPHNKGIHTYGVYQYVPKQSKVPSE